MRKRGADQGARALGDDPEFQQTQWRVERISWCVMVIIIASALAGLLGGGGPLSRDTKTDPDSSNRIEYERFARHASPMTLDVNIASGADRQVRLRVSDEYFAAMNVQSITPPPSSTSLGDKQQILVFDRSASSVAVTIRFQIAPMVFGIQRGWVAVDGGAPISFSHFIFP